MSTIIWVIYWEKDDAKNEIVVIELNVAIGRDSFLPVVFFMFSFVSS